MTVPKKLIVLVLMSSFAAAGLCACDNRGGTPGEKLDNALDKTGDKVKEAGEAIKPK